MDPGAIRDSRGYRILIGVGLASYGLMHLVLAWIALQVAFGKKGDASNAGALRQVAQQPLGEVLLWVMAVGLLALTPWQVLEAIFGRPKSGRFGLARRRVSSSGRAVVYLALGLLAIGVTLGAGSGGGGGEETLTARLLAVPFGRVLVALVGAVVIGIGIAKIVKGVRQKFRDDLRHAGPALSKLGTVGYCAKGVAFLIIGGLFGWAALTYDADKAGGMDAALSTIREQPFGTVLLAIMAGGIACFGLYCFGWARRARV